MKKIFLIHLLLLTFVSQLCAQSVDLTDDEKDVIASRIVDKLDDFQYFLQTMSDKRNSTSVRMNAKKSNENLFIGKCEPYEYTTWDGELKMHKAVKMQTSSVNRNTKSTQTMKRYLERLFNGMGYSNIEITQSEAVRVDNFRKVGDGKYEAVAYFIQDFKGYNERGSIRYSDETKKGVKVLIDLIEVPTEDGYEKIWEITLSDMYVIETKRI